MAPAALNLAGYGRLHAKSAGNGLTPARSARIRPGPVVVATGAPPCSTCSTAASCPCPCRHKDDARRARSQHSRGPPPSRPGIKPRPSPSRIFCRSVTAHAWHHLEISPDATTIFRCGKERVQLLFDVVIRCECDDNGSPKFQYTVEEYYIDVAFLEVWKLQPRIR